MRVPNNRQRLLNWHQVFWSAVTGSNHFFFFHNHRFRFQIRTNLRKSSSGSRFGISCPRLRSGCRFKYFWPWFRSGLRSGFDHVTWQLVKTVSSSKFGTLNRSSVWAKSSNEHSEAPCKPDECSKIQFLRSTCWKIWYNMIKKLAHFEESYLSVHADGQLIQLKSMAYSLPNTKNWIVINTLYWVTCSWMWFQTDHFGISRIRTWTVHS